jgi:hypothetical protein
LGKLVAFVFVASLLLACRENASEYPSPVQSPSEVKLAAIAYLEQQQVDAADYELKLLGFDYIERSWRVMFTGKSGVLHDTYWLEVSDDNITDILLRKN